MGEMTWQKSLFGGFFKVKYIDGVLGAADYLRCIRIQDIECRLATANTGLAAR